MLDNSTSTRVATNNGIASISSGAILGNESLLKSKRSPRYQPNRGHLYSTAVFLENPTDNGFRDFGMFTIDNGVYFRLKNDGKLYARIDSLGANQYEQEIIIPFTIDLSKGNIFDIQMQWRGVGNFSWFIGNPATGKVTKVHTANLLGTLDGKASISNPALPCCYRSINNGDNVTIKTSCVDITSEGGQAENYVYGSIIGTVASLPSSSNVEFLAVKISETFNGEINTRDVILDRITTSCDNESVITVYSTNDPSVFAGTTWNDYRGRDNIQYAYAYDLYANMTSTSLFPLITTRVEQDFKNEIINPSRMNSFYLSAGDFILIAVKASTGNSFTSTLEFSEEV